MFCQLENMFYPLVSERPRLQTKLRELISNTIKACDLTYQIVNNDRNNIYSEKSLTLTREKGEDLATETLRLLTSLAGEAGAHENYNSREIVRGSLIIRNMEHIMKTVTRMAEIRMAATRTEKSALNIEVSSLTSATLETLKICLKNLASSFKKEMDINKTSVKIDFERKIQHAFETAINEDDLEHSHKAVEMIDAVESLNRSIYSCSKY